ncbi:MAG: hypothetical protein K0Q67_2263 [Cellvibrio sp.]|jgi:hypothetical protein|nr:hypothetical protein [Cellvibrio sp.]
MSLLDVQRSLVGFARGSSAEYHHCGNLTPSEDKWLKQLLDAPGLHITQQVQQWWRISRVCATAPLTVALLKRHGLEELIVEYIITEPIRTLFFAAELDQFKTFLRGKALVDHTTRTLVEFEAGIKTAAQLAAAGNEVSTESFSLLLRFQCYPPALFAALLTGTPLPALEQQDYYLEINPSLESLWRCWDNCYHNCRLNCHTNCSSNCRSDRAPQHLQRDDAIHTDVPRLPSKVAENHI